MCLSIHLSVCPQGGYPSQVQLGGGVPHLARWGVPGQVQMGGVPWPGSSRGVPQPGPVRGVPQPGGYPPPGQVQQRGVLQPGPDRGVPPNRDGVPPGMGYPPPRSTGQQMEYLIRRGRYASCVHVGGLSCILCFETNDE